MGIFRELFQDYRFALGFTFLLTLVILAFLSFFSPYDPVEWLQVPRDIPPSWPHILGTNSKGQDVFWEATFAIRNSLIIAFIAALLSRIIATIVGLLAGYKGGIIDQALMFFTDSILVLPLIMMLILVASIMKGQLSLIGLGILLAFFGWSWDARTIRSQVLSLREQIFTQTAILSGKSVLSLVFGEYMPHITPLLLSTVLSNMTWSISSEITLAILGLSKLETPTLGTMLHWALRRQALLLGYWWWIMTPITLTLVLLIGLYFISVSLCEYMDPRSRLQRATME
ncbi:MAG: ABC transporter permease [Candidatus Caldatribacteriaceae bacterium]